MNKRVPFEELFFSKTKDFLDLFLIKQQGRSEKTSRAYRNALSGFYDYITAVKEIKPTMFCFTDCTYEFVLDYSQYMQETKKLSESSVNQRLAAIKSYLKYVADGNIELMQVWLSVQKVPNLRVPKLHRPVLEKDELKALLDSPADTEKGIRDKMMLILLFDTAMRASELIGIRLGDVLLNVKYPLILIHGKGRKERSVTLTEKTARLLGEYIGRYHETGAAPDTPLFYTVIHGNMNHMSERNVERIVNKYANIIRVEKPSIPKSVYPHMMRRSRASGMYRDGVPLEMISTILGHANTEVTKSYAIPSVEQLRNALQKGQAADNEKKLWAGKEDEIRRMFGLT